MDSIHSILGMLHVAAGFVALAAFWFPLFLKKGAKAHRTFGWIFVGAMSVILVSAATMTLVAVFSGSPNRNFALFLGFLTLITFAAVWTGVRVLRHKTDPGWLRSPAQAVILVVIGAAGVGLLWQWWETRFPLFFVFGLLGLLIAVPELLKWRRPQHLEPRFWWFVHLENMIVSGMAAHIAFLAVGAQRIWPELYSGYPWWMQILPWVAPFPIAFGAIVLIQRHYRRKFAGA